MILRTADEADRWCSHLVNNMRNHLDRGGVILVICRHCGHSLVRYPLVVCSKCGKETQTFGTQYLYGLPIIIECECGNEVMRPIKGSRTFNN